MRIAGSLEGASLHPSDDIGKNESERRGAPSEPLEKSEYQTKVRQ